MANTINRESTTDAPPPNEIISGWPPKSFVFTGEWDRQRKYQSNPKVANRNKVDIWHPIYRASDGEMFVLATYGTEVCPTQRAADESTCTTKYHAALAEKGDTRCGVCGSPLRR